MPAADAFRPFVERLEALGLPDMLTGSVATTLYGEPSYTHDVDLVLQLQEDRFCSPPADVIRTEIRRPARGHLEDVAAVLEVQGAAIDRARIEAEVAARGLAPEWAEALRRYSGT